MPNLSIAANINGTLAGVAYNDIYLDMNGNIAMSRDLQAVLENCAQAAKTLLGECVLNTLEGIPYFTAIFAGVVNLEQFSAALRSAWNNVNGVTEVLSLDVNNSNNVLTYQAVINTIYGVGTLNEPIATSL